MDRRVFVGFLLAIFGGLSSLVLFSISPSEARGQLMFALLGVLAYTGTQFVPRRLIRLSVTPLYLLVLGMLLFTLVAGHQAKGAQRWFGYGSYRIQVSELAKPVLALTLCTFVTHGGLKRQRRIVLYALISSLYIIPVLLQPDLGSALVLSAIAAAICVFSVRRWTMLFPWMVLLLITSVIAWEFVLYPYQKQRIFSFIGSSTDKAASYNVEQAIIAVGSGKVTGRGLGHGIQTTLRFLPEHHTDFFFASFAEETGFLGVVALLGLYLSLFGALLWKMVELDGFDRVLRFSLLCGLMFQTFVHVFMNIGLAPVTGIPLPFLSSGGSSFVSLALFLGLALRFHRQSRYRLIASEHGFLEPTEGELQSEDGKIRWSFAL